MGQVHIGEHLENDVHTASPGRLQYPLLITHLAVIENVMRALAFYEVDTFLRSGRAEDGEAHGSRHLHCRGADSAARSMYQDGFGSAGFRGVMERVIRGPVGNPHACPLAKTDVVGQGMHLLFQRESVFRVRARNGLRRVDAVARLHFFHTIADGLNDACAIRSWRVGKQRFDGVGARAHIGVVGIHTCGADSDENLSGGKSWRGDFFELQDFETAKFTNENGLHCFSPKK